MRMEQKPVAVQSAVREAVETVRTYADTSRVRIESALDDSQEAIVTGDRARLVQAFANLLDNAVKFSRPGNLVKISCQRDGGAATVRVEDEGRGISPDFLPFVFERFRQEDGSKTRAHGGLGLGLALVKSFVEAHQGTIHADSAGSGHGSRFTISLPCVEAVKVAGSLSADKLGRSAAHLMIIEDDDDTLEMLRATLEMRGFRVTTCESAAETLRIAPVTSVDLIISDIGMPLMDGLEMIQRLRELENYQSVPAIALTGYASSKDEKAALTAGFDAHVSKPIDPAELLRLIDKFVKKKAGR
jgi:CheY-like chemotaxis protein/two-component sensor histidine kinase